MIEHNMAAAGKIYDNIRLAELASLLGLPTAAKAEKVRAKLRFSLFFFSSRILVAFYPL